MSPHAETARPDPVPDGVVLAGRGLVKEYGSDGTVTRALDGVDIDVRQGGFLVIMGPSGSGKSTLLHLLGGLDVPTSGRVLLEGRGLAELTDRQITLLRRRRIGFVFQFFNLVPVLSVEENIALPLVIEGRKPAQYRQRLDSLIRVVGLTDERRRLPSQISGGQQQRVAIARALLPRPAVLLADEPTGNLDSQTGMHVMRLLKGVQRKLGQTTVVVTHDPQVAAYGDRVVHIRDGRIEDTLDLRRRRLKGGEARAQAVLAWLQELGA